jgi:hypothetical protein
MSNIISRTIAGIGLIILGSIFLVLSFFQWKLLIYAISFLVLGIWIFLNEKEDDIEKIRYNGRKRK